ncbi:hypothetical protein BGZ60DRAFT_527576 [Tricladium varicosporioides]|nr:hypothetical protein BGZ60DRAFT_527576 [Hymenoscyphus varicosporioides]
MSSMKLQVFETMSTTFNKVTTYKFTTTTDFAIGPITEYPYIFTTLPPGTLTDTLTEYLEEITITIVCSSLFSSELTNVDLNQYTTLCTVSATEVVDAPFTTTTTIIAYANPLPTVASSVISTACRCLSLPQSFITESFTIIDTLAYTTITAPLEIFTNYENVIFDQSTTTLPVTLHFPFFITPIRDYTTEIIPYPIVVIEVTSTVGGGIIGIATMTKHTKKSKPSKTKITKPAKPTKPSKIAKSTKHR